MKKIEEKRTKKREELQLHPKELGSPFNSENRVQKEKLPSNSRLTKIYFAIDRLKEGNSRKTVEKLLESEYKIQPNISIEIVTSAMSVVAEQYFSENELVISLHVQRYNREINSLFKKKFDEFDIPIKRKLEIQNYFNILDIMSQKEALLQLHNRNTIIRINQKNTLIKQQRDNSLDSINFDRLTLDEKVELLKLIQKTKTSEEELIGVKLNSTIGEEVEFEEVKEEKTEPEVNITQITLEDKLKEKEDSSPKPMTLLDLREEMKKRLMERAKEEFKRAGSKDGNLQ